jgi:hypothetical protein
MRLIGTSVAPPRQTSGAALGPDGSEKQRRPKAQRPKGQLHGYLNDSLDIDSHGLPLLHLQRARRHMDVHALRGVLAWVYDGYLTNEGADGVHVLEHVFQRPHRP